MLIKQEKYRRAPIVCERLDANFLRTRCTKKSLSSLYFHSLGSDVSDHFFFWSEYRVNRTRFHSLRVKFSLYWS